jgi:hypothetical protein
VMRKTLSWSQLRQFISDQRTQDINHLLGERIFPTEEQVRSELAKRRASKSRDVRAALQTH